MNIMSKAEVLEELPRLTPQELAEVQAKLDELTGDVWIDRGELSAFDAALADYEKNPDAGSSWSDVKARIAGKLRA